MKLLKQDKPNIRSYYGDGYDIVDVDLSVIDHLGSYIGSTKEPTASILNPNVSASKPKKIRTNVQTDESIKVNIDKLQINMKLYHCKSRLMIGSTYLI